MYGRFEKIYELGSGWGTIGFPISRKYRSKKIICFENSLMPYVYSYLLNKVSNFNNLVICKKNFYQASLREADIVICYLYPEAMKRLRYKFEEELKPGALVISNTFAVPGWQSMSVIELEDLYRSKIYKYIKQE
jgi:hypothetical protein